MSDSQYTLYSYFRSSCSARLRIALNIKSIKYDMVYINLLKNEQMSDEHKALNPSASVPVLINKTSKGTPFKVGQSVAALEYLEEKHPDTPMLPPTSDPEARAMVRTLVDIVCVDIQPPTNLRIMRRVRELGGSAEEWNLQLMTQGMAAYENVVAGTAGKYSFGDEVTLADVCLIPAIWGAQRFGVDLKAFPTISRIVENLKDHPAVVRAHWQNQADTPENLRA
ncbi:hypothetical protein CEP54_013701 [Fusarium duplospermum]|uniref:Maleylacetoacetate isomerase n=1 Tax=Fusarium duplospermum TaxID=1325734 RepID=A0A428P174_9HYPO|nr:hypothetical protein CEP54_013701 [Fusarium duplospermum]